MLSYRGYASLSHRPSPRVVLCPLFVNSRGERLTQYWVLKRFRELLCKVGFEGEDFSGISLRRGGAQTLLKLDANDTIVMGMGGKNRHASTDT